MPTPQQRKKLRDALINAFPERSSLEQLLYFELGKNLNEITKDSNLQYVVYQLIQTAEAQGWLLTLVRVAQKENPGNLQLSAIATELLTDNPITTPYNSSKENAIAEPAPSDDLSSDRNIDYTKLRDFLKAGQWFEADEETLAVILKVALREKEGWLDKKSIENFPCTDLRTIDQLWVKYSDGRFGFSVQKRIWESVDKDYEKLGDRVGWRKTKEWLLYSQITFDIKAPLGHLPKALWEAIDISLRHRVWGGGWFQVGLLFSRVGSRA